jgi:16S rRNA G966 N2-methylase RsmD
MSIGNSGRIVIEITSDKKRHLYSELSRRGISLKGWFLDRVDEYLRNNSESNLMDALELPTLGSTENNTNSNTSILKNNASRPVVKKTNNNHKKLDDVYEDLERRYSVRILSNEVSYTSPVNFVESMRCPRHRWFPYKEGFSPTFVKEFITEFSQTKSGIILDPFSGVGTTGLVASSMGFNAVGLDVSPMAVFISKTKAIKLNKSELQKFANYIVEIGKSPLNEQYENPQNDTVISYFDPAYLSSLLRIRSIVDAAPNAKVKNLALLAFLTLIEEFSTHRKAGNGVKRKTKLSYLGTNEYPINKVRIAFINKLMEMQDDLESDHLTDIPNFKIASCIDKGSLANLSDIELVLTSPPYANCFDYSKIYMRELWLGGFFKSVLDQKDFRNQSLRSHVHSTWDERHSKFGSEIAEQLICPKLESQELWSNKIPSMISGYFKDIGALLAEVKPRLKRGGSFGVVVGNSVYGGITVASDLLIAQMAEKMGYEVSRIDVYRGVIPSSQQYKLVENKKWARESTVIVKKK